MADSKKRVEDSRAATDKRTKEYYDKQAKLKPTPTQHENDLARVGTPAEKPEADGSETEAEIAKRSGKEAVEDTDSHPPTPTQEENDLARMGNLPEGPAPVEPDPAAEPPPVSPPPPPPVTQTAKRER